MRLADDYEYESKEEEKKQSDKKPDKKEPPKKPTKIDANEFNELINKEETDINSELFQKHFNFWRPSEMLKAIYDTINRRKSKELVVLIVSIVEKIFEFNRQKQEGQGTKILTSDQMLSRLPISLAQLKAENNSENLKLK